MTEKELMLAEKLYMSFDEKLSTERIHARQLTRLFNNTTEEQEKYRIELLKELFNKTGDNIYVEPPFRCDYGSNITVGDNFYANFDCIILDVNEVIIGDNVLFAPRVCIYTAGHPIDADIRNSGVEFGKKVIIGSNVWIGGSTVINPGITIGDNVVIGSGSVVTKDIPKGVVAVGNPCRVLRKITDEDRKLWAGQVEERKRLLNENI